MRRVSALLRANKQRAGGEQMVSMTGVMGGHGGRMR